MHFWKPGFSSQLNQELQQANAAHIVHAVNCHSELVECVRSMCAMFDDSVFIYGTDDQEKVRKWLRQAARVLAKSEGDK